MTALEIGTLIGLITAIGSFIGVIGGGYFGDKLREKYAGGRLYVIFVGGGLITTFGCFGMIYSETKNMILLKKKLLIKIFSQSQNICGSLLKN